MLFLHATDAYILQSLHRKKQATNNMPYCRYQDNEMLESINHFAIFFFLFACGIYSRHTFGFHGSFSKIF